MMTPDRLAKSPTEPSEPLLQATDLRMHFAAPRQAWRRGKPAQAVLRGINLEIKRGEALAIVGESGSGKTTLGRCLLRLYRPTGGRLVFDTIDYTDSNAATMRPLRRRMQMIFQDPLSSLNPRHRVGALVAQPLRAFAQFQPHNAAERRQKVSAVLQRVGLDDSFLQRYPHELSGGQRQRVGIARAIIVQPDFIVADEIVSGLDVSTQAQILMLLRDLQQEMGLSLVFISHDLSVVRMLCDTVAVMLEGQIIERGACQALFEAPQMPYTQQLLAAVPLPTIDHGWLWRDKEEDADRRMGMQVSGKTILVTGANRGIGQAFVDALRARGAKKIYAGVRQSGAMGETDAAVEEISLDITDSQAVAAAAAACGDVQMLINNAAVNHNDHLLQARDGEDARREMETNYFGTLAMCRAFAPVIEGNGGGAIVNIASIVARAPIPLMGSLSASKAAVYSMTQSIRAELAPKGIHVAAVLPGAVDTRMSENFPGDKPAPSAIAETVLDAVAAGESDIYPGEMAAGLQQGLATNRPATLAELAQYV